MNASRTSRLLLRYYPSAWRERYGEELQSLIVECSDGDRVPWRMRRDVMRAGVGERLRATGLSGDGAPAERVRDGLLLVLYAWALLVVGGLGVQKFSEHWREATPAGSRALPSDAFGVLVVVAIGGALLVLAGIGAAAPALAAFVREGGWVKVRRRVISAALLTAVAVAGTVGLVIWAGGLTPGQRNGHDTAYAIAFVVWVLLAVGCLLGWTATTAAVVRRLPLSTHTLRTEVRLAIAATAAMWVMAAATVVWWVETADSAPWFFAGRPIGQSGSPFAVQMVLATSLIVLASTLATVGTRRAIRAMPAISGERLR